MKTTDVSRFSAWMLTAILGLGVPACDDGKQPDEVVSGPTAPLKVESIISDPKVGEPGDTLMFTAVITSNEPNEGDFPVMEWSATGGSFIDTREQTVRWLAPASSGAFIITAKATNHINSSTGKATVFVGAGQTLLTENAGQINLIGGGPDFRYYRTTDVTRGVDIHQYVGGVSSDPIPPGPPPNPLGQLNTTFSRDGSLEAHAADTLVFATITRPRHIYIGDFAAGTYYRLTVDGANPLFPDRNQFNHPSFSPNGEVVAYQRLAQSWDGNAPDSFHVYIHDIVAHKRTLVTYEHEYPRGFFPTFSTDGKWLVYVVDRLRNGQWDLYGSPMTGNNVDGSLASLTRMTNTGGLIVTGAPRDLKKPPMAWNPVSSVLAIAAADNTLYLVATTPTGSNVTPIPEVFRAQELVWSPGGGQLAASTASVIYTVTAGGAVTERVAAMPGDNLRDMAFSPDEKWLLYRVSRGGGSWFNVLDIGAGRLTEPVPVTATGPVGIATTYRGVMSLRPAWTGGNLMIYPAFGTSANNTPGIFSRDLSGLVD